MKNGWHNIKKNPKDLPTEDGVVLTVEKQYGEPWYETKYFLTGSNVFGGDRSNIIAWHKIPKYEGELE